MNVNIDGLRTQATKELNSLKDLLMDASKHGTYIDDEIKEQFNALAQCVGFFNCVYDPEMENFSDLSDKLKVNFFDDV